MRHQHIALMAGLLLSCVACGQSQNTPQTSCPDGQIQDPNTQECKIAPQVDATLDLGEPVDSKSDEAFDEVSVQDERVDVQDDAVEDVAADEPPPVVEVRRFVALGDTGTGSAMQLKVGQAIGTACTQLGGCDFALLLGDNAYNSGMDSADDPRFVEFFENPYGHLGFPFYAVLGNHDLGGGGAGVSLDQKKADYQIEYSQRNAQWRMPSRHYKVVEGPVWMVGLNTTNVFFGRDDAQRVDVQTWLNGAPTTGWKIAFGHHPYLSNGRHGNAGNYEGLPFVPIVNGEHVASFMEDIVCGNFDLYLCGHDHNVQDLQATCGTEFIVSGAGAKTTDLKGSNPVHYESDEPGFVILEASATIMTLRFYDQDATLQHTRTLTK